MQLPAGLNQRIKTVDVLVRLLVLFSARRRGDLPDRWGVLWSAAQMP